MFKKIAIGLVVLIAVILVLAAFQPNTFHLERSTVVAAPAAKVFPQINDFHNWKNWDPWAKLDPAMKLDITGAKEGKGAVYEWKGNNQVGQGRMEITDSVQASKVSIDLEFIKPFQAHNIATFTLTPQGKDTKVTWAMDGPVPLVAKVCHLFVSMDKMVGGQFDKGLADLKTAAEK